MAARYWIGGGTNTNWNSSPTTNWSATSGGAVRVAAPTSADNVFFDANGNSASIISAAAACLTLTISSGYTNTITHNAVLTVSGNVTLGANYTIAGTSAMTINATSTITSNGKTWPNNMTWNGSVTATLNGNFTVIGALSTTGATTIDKTTSESITVNGGFSYNQNVTGTCEIVLGGGTITMSGGVRSISNNLTFNGNVTFGSDIRYISNTIKYTGGTINQGVFQLLIYSDCTVDFNSCILQLLTVAPLGITITLPSILQANTLNLTGNTTFQGSYGFSVNSLLCPQTGSSTITLQEGVTYTITSELTAYSSRVGSILLFISSHGTNKAILTLNNGATCRCLADFTRIDASGGRPIRTFNGTVTDCDNIVSFYDLKTATI